ncbi:MAG: Argininosuccinate lyase [Phycisphaerae bacterium]|nr:Argininosuccinate lyase [Phycisphaerae bacterium]
MAKKQARKTAKSSRRPRPSRPAGGSDRRNPSKAKPKPRPPAKAAKPVPRPAAKPKSPPAQPVPAKSKAPRKSRKQASRSWQARLAAEPADLTVAYGESLSIDHRLYEQDIAGSVAHATMLQEAGLISGADLLRIRRGLEHIRQQISAGTFAFDATQEDIHMAIEAALIKDVGDAGRKLHTARSRNDQVALDLRLWLRDQVAGLQALIRELQAALLRQAEDHADVVLPAYTHLQRAQPIELGAYLLAWIEMLQRDADRLADCRKRINVSPLGAGAVAGTTLPINRQRVAELLGMDGVLASAVDATSERDVAAEFLFCVTMVGLHLSRWAEDGCIYASQEFGFLRIDDAYCTSSSMMPQKRNPDLLELMRGRAAVVLGQLVGLLGLLKGLPLAYNRDLQEDKRLIFTAVDTVRLSLRVAAEIVRHSRYNAETAEKAAAGGLTDATALAEYLVGKGVPFRTAHQYVGEVVQLAEGQGVSLVEMPLDQLQAVADEVADDVFQWLGARRVVKRYTSYGAGGGEPLAQQLAAWKQRLK